MGRVTVRRKVRTITLGDSGATERTRPDTLTVEEPLEIRVDGTPLTVTMRTPGHDMDLVHGFLQSEGIISAPTDVSVARYCAGAVTSGETGYDENTYNVIDVTLAPGVPKPEPSVARNFFTTSSCGVCGKASLEQLKANSRYDLIVDEQTFAAETLAAMPETLRTQQPSFDKTGGLHAAGLFRADGSLVLAREDIGRHNAVDKVIGAALLAELLPARGHALVVSSRASFELAQKAVMAGIPCLAAVSAASSLAVDCAAENGMTLIGFARGDRLNVYNDLDRVTLQEEKS